VSKEGRRERDRRRSWERRREASGINNGWQILRDRVATLIMHTTQPQGQGNLPEEGYKALKPESTKSV